MGKKSYPYFRIGTIAGLTGVNIQTIRRYEAKGILSGKREENSQYRFFDLLELTLLIRTRMYRNYGFSLNDVVELLNTTPEENHALFADRQNSLAHQIEREKQLLHCMERQMEYLEQSDYYTTHCELRNSPEMYGLFYFDEAPLTGDPDREALISRWIDETPFVLPMMRLTKGHITGEKKVLQVGLCVTKEYAEMLGLGNDPFSFHIPSFPCIYTMSSSAGLIGYEEENKPAGVDEDLVAIQDRAFAHAAEFCRTNGLLPKDGIIGSTFYSTREKGRLRHFSHLWIPYERA